MSFFLNFFRKIKNRLYPNLTKREHKRWIKDGADFALRFNYPLTYNSIIFDLGGFKGDFASDLFSRMPCKIYIFEPVRDYAVRIDKRFKLNTNILVYSFGLSHKTEEKYITLDGSGSSLYRNTMIKNVNLPREKVKLVDVVEFIDSNKISEIDLFKINIEGGEYDVIPRLLDTKMINKIKYIQIQFHELEKNSKHKKELIRKRLMETHTCDYCYEYVWENWVRNDLIIY